MSRFSQQDFRFLKKAIISLSTRSNARDKPSSKIWTLANSALGIWVLTTIVLGSASALWTKRLECRSQYVESERRFIEAFSEYQYRQNQYLFALREAKDLVSRQKAERWRLGYVDHTHTSFQSRTMADVALDMLRSFGDLSLVSDVESFEIEGSSLSFTRRDGSITLTSQSSPGALQINTALIGAPVHHQQEKAQNTASDITNINLAIERIRNSMYGADPVFSAVRNSAMLKPAPQCGFSDIASRMFIDENPIYEKQVSRLFEAMLRDYQQQMIILHSIEQLIQDPNTPASPKEPVRLQNKALLPTGAASDG